MRMLIAVMVMGALGGCATTPQEIRALTPMLVKETASPPARAAACIERTIQDLGMQVAIRPTSENNMEALVTMATIGMRLVIDISAIEKGSRLTAYVSDDLLFRQVFAEKTLGDC